MPETMLFMAACAREEGDDAKALALLRKTIAADPDWATPELWLAEILAADGDATAEALRHAARALDLAEEETDFLSAVALKAGLEAELGEADDARRTLEELPPPEVKLGDLELALEIAHLHIALGDPKTARARLRVLSEEHPEVGMSGTRSAARPRTWATMTRCWPPGSGPGRSIRRRVRGGRRRTGCRRRRSPRWPGRRWRSCPSARAIC